MKLKESEMRLEQTRLCVLGGFAGAMQRQAHA